LGTRASPQLPQSPAPPPSAPAPPLSNPTHPFGLGPVATPVPPAPLLLSAWGKRGTRQRAGSNCMRGAAVCLTTHARSRRAPRRAPPRPQAAVRCYRRAVANGDREGIALHKLVRGPRGDLLPGVARGRPPHACAREGGRACRRASRAGPRACSSSGGFDQRPAARGDRPSQPPAATARGGRPRKPAPTPHPPHPPNPRPSCMRAWATAPPRRTTTASTSSASTRWGRPRAATPSTPSSSWPSSAGCADRGWRGRLEARPRGAPRRGRRLGLGGGASVLRAGLAGRRPRRAASVGVALRT
jgi:hypothetical protein